MACCEAKRAFLQFFGLVDVQNIPNAKANDGNMVLLCIPDGAYLYMSLYNSPLALMKKNGKYAQSTDLTMRAILVSRNHTTQKYDPAYSDWDNGRCLACFFLKSLHSYKSPYLVSSYDHGLVFLSMGLAT